MCGKTGVYRRSDRDVVRDCGDAGFRAAPVDAVFLCLHGAWPRDGGSEGGGADGTMDARRGRPGSAPMLSPWLHRSNSSLDLVPARDLVLPLFRRTRHARASLGETPDG